jgi:hypothetical protein
LQCECDPSSFFIWNAAQLKCVCLSGYYLKDKLCYPCADLPGNNPAISVLNNCSCNAAGLFGWSIPLSKCLCSVGNYLDVDVCKSCKTLPGAATNASSSDNKCFCNTAKFYQWSTIANKCVCNSTSYLTAAGVCNTCANVSATGLDGLSCACPDGKEWANFACFCAIDTYLDISLASPACAPCSGLADTVTTEAPTTPGTCVCDSAKKLNFSLTLSKCVCENSTY